MIRPSNWLSRLLGVGSAVERGRIVVALEEEVGRIAPDAGGESVFFTRREFFTGGDANPPWAQATLERPVEFERLRPPAEAAP